MKPTVRNRWPSPTPLHPSRADFSPGWNVYFVLSKSHAVRSSFSVTLLSRVKIPLAPRLSAAVFCSARFFGSYSFMYSFFSPNGELLVKVEAIDLSYPPASRCSIHIGYSEWKETTGQEI